MKRHHNKLISVVFVCAVVLACPVFANLILYVDDDAAPGGDGLSWDTAYKFLQDALTHANDLAPEPIEVHIAAGVYKPDQSEVYPSSYGFASSDRNATFLIPSGVTVRGAYYGLPALRTSAVVLSGDLAGNDVEVTSPELLSGERAVDRDALLLPSDSDDETPKKAGGEPTRLDNSFHVVRMKDASVLAGVIVTGGYAHRSRVSNTYGFPEHGGGGVWINGNDTTLRSCLITGNYAEEVGGGVWCTRQEGVTLEDCTIRGNATRYFGGGIWVRDSSILLENCSLVGNWAEFERGGAGYISRFTESTEATFRNCFFEENKSNNNGGGLYIKDSTVKFIDCGFKSNSGRLGGGLLIDGNRRVYDNSVLIENCRFISNSAMDHGGAILCADMELICKNSVFCGNVALEGGGLSIAYSDLNLFNCTITNNRAEVGRFLLDRSQEREDLPDGIVQISNCIVSNGGDEILNRYASINLEYSNSEGGQSAITDPHNRTIWNSTNIDIDPYFADPGHWDLNNTPDDPNDDVFVEGDYHLKSEGGRWDSVNQAWVRDDVTSPCIDAGDPNSPVGLEPFPNGNRINMGAYGGTLEASKSLGR